VLVQFKLKKFLRLSRLERGLMMLKSMKLADVLDL